MDIQNQIELEQLYAKNQTMSRLREEFSIPEIKDHLVLNEIPVPFGIDLLAQMVLHKRANMSLLVGTLHSHFGDDTAALQACADMICKASVADLVDFDEMSNKFVIRIDVPDKVREDLDRFQYPLPMVVEPLEVKTNRDTGYVTLKGSVILGKNHHSDDVCLDHINRVNKIPLAINPDTARMVANQWKNLDKPKEGEEKDEYAKRVKAFEKYDSVSREVMESLYMTEEPIYLTHSFDKRGRCYAQGYHVNPQGSAWNKAVVEFANQELVR